MPTVNEFELQEFRDWKFRFRPATATPSRLAVLLHGFTGDENSMWIFSRKLPARMAVLAPRGIYLQQEGGYSWRKRQPGNLSLPTLEDLCPAAEALIRFIDDWPGSAGGFDNQIDLIGFSQGAALAYTLALLFPDRIRALAALSGFLPSGTEGLINSHILAGKSIFIAHGRQDNLVPVENARKTVTLLERSGARVKYCESNLGHKVNVTCFSEMSDIF